MPDPREVQCMFGRIARRYDFLNRVLSLGVDRSWRGRAVREAGPLAGRIVVDACSGTGDLAFAFSRAGARVVGVDFTREMLAHARRKSAPAGSAPVFAVGDALRLPIRSGVADVASVAFGVRNLADPRQGLCELARVVKPGGRVLVLEFSPPPRGALGALFRIYFTRILPRIGGWISGDREAYRYLPRTVAAWPVPDELLRDLEAVGLVECGYVSLSAGIACLHWGKVAGAAVPARDDRAERAA